MKNLEKLKNTSIRTWATLLVSFFLYSGQAMAIPFSLESGAYSTTSDGDPHLGLNLGSPNRLSGYGLLSGNSEYGSGFSLTSSSFGISSFDPFNLWSDSLFNDDDLLTFGQSDCRSTCDSKSWNCGWGPVSDTYLRTQLNRCGFNYDRNRKIEPASNTAGVQIQCEIGGQVKTSETSLDSIKDLIGYDCSNMGELGDEFYCLCVLNKSGNPNDLYYSPLTKAEVDTIESLMTLNDYQVDVKALSTSFESISEILGDALATNNKEIKDMIAADPEAKVCTPGGMVQLEEFLTAEREDLGDGQKGSVCGARGYQSLSNLHNLNKAEERAQAREELEAFGGPTSSAGVAAAAANSGPNEIRIASLHEEGVGMLEDINHAQAQRIGVEYNLNDQDISHFQKGIDMAELMTAACDKSQRMQAAISQAGAAIMGTTARHFCREGIDGVSVTYSLSQQLVNIMRDYRTRGKNDPASFVAEIRSKRPEMLDKLKEGISEKYKVIDKGIFKHHAYQMSPMEKMIETLDAVIPPGTDIFNSGKEGELVGAVEKGLTNLQKEVVSEAMGRCKQFVESTVNICQELDKKGTADAEDRELEVDDYKDFELDRAFSYAKIPDLLGPLKGNKGGPLYRKFSQLRCARIIGDEKLAAQAFAKGEEEDGLIGPVQPSGLDGIIAYNEKSSSVDVKGSSDYNPWAASSEVRDRVFRDSKREGIRQVAASLRSQAESTFGGSSNKIAGISTDEGDLKKGNLEFSDTQTTMGKIADMTAQTLGGNANTVQDDNQILPTNYDTEIRNMNSSERTREKDIAQREQDAAEERLEVIAQRLADLVEKQNTNTQSREDKESTKSDEELAQDPDYQKMLIEKLELEREIAALERQKLENVQKKKAAAAKIAEVEKAETEETSFGTGAGAGSGDSSVAATNTNKSKGSGSSSKRSPASVGSGSFSGGGGGGSSSSVAGSSESDSFFNNAPYVITLTQDQVTAIKENFQVVENPSSWVPGGKPPVIREGNIFYELQVKDGKIVVDALGRPLKKKALNGFNVDGLRQPASEIADLPKEVDKDDVARRRAARVRELNALLDQQ